MADSDDPMSGESESSGQPATPTVNCVDRLSSGLPVRQIVFLESAQSYLIFSQENEVYVLPNDTRNPVKVAKGPALDRAFAAYASSRRSLIFHNNHQVTVRRDLNSVFSLQTAFGSVIEEGDDKVLEVPVQEVTQWVNYFNSTPKRFEDTPELKDFMVLLSAALSATDDAQKGLTLLVKVPRCRELFSEVESLSKKVIKEEKAEFPVFPLLFWLVERLRWTLNGIHPYHPQNSSESTGRMADVSTMNSEAARALSFYRWPHMNFPFALPSRLAETGFFFQPSTSADDRVVCFSCSISLNAWEANDEPLQEHERHHSNHCRFMDEVLSENVPLDVSCSILPPVRIGFKEAGEIIATMNASAEFFAIASDEVFATTARLKVIHIDSAPLQVFNVSIPLLKDFKTICGYMFNPHFESSAEFGRITSLSVAGREKFTKSGERDDADADCLLHIGLVVNSKALKQYCDEEYWVPMMFIYKLSRHLREKTETNEQSVKRFQKHGDLLADLQTVVDDVSSGNDPLSEEVHFHDDDVVEHDFWSSDELMDDNYDLKLKMSKKTRARHEEPNPFVDIDYAPYKIKPTLIGSASICGVKGSGWEIKNIFASDVDNGLITAVLVHPTKNTTIVVFPRCNESQPLAINRGMKPYTMSNPVIKKIHILPVDHFASYRAASISEPEPFGTNIAIGTLITLLSNNQLLLFDPASGATVEIGNGIVDFTVDDKQNVIGVNKTGEFGTFRIATPLAAIHSERIDEIALNFVGSTTNEFTRKVTEEIRELFPNHTSLEPAIELINSLPVYKPFDERTLAHVRELVQSRPVKSMATQARVMTSKTAIAALESFLQHSLGFQMVAPPHWVESLQAVPNRIGTPVQSLNIEGSSTPAQRLKETLAQDERPSPTRVWKFNPEKETTKSAYVFEMTILPCKPLSHINFKFTFGSNSNGAPDISFKIYRSKQQRVSRTFGNDDVTRLIPYCNDPSLLDVECARMMQTLQVKNFIDLHSNHAIIQINASTILDALASSSLGDEWFTRPVTLYLVIEVSNHLSLVQQINARTAVTLAASRSKNKADKSKSTRSSGMTKKKLAHSRKAILLKNQKQLLGFQGLKQLTSNRLNLTKRKEAISRKKPEDNNQGNLEPKMGIAFIEDFSITVYRTSDDDTTHAHLQRLVLQKDRVVQDRLLDLAMRRSVVELGYSSLNDVCACQQRALDVLIWVTQNWRLFRINYSQCLSIVQRIVDGFQEVFLVGFATAPKRVAQRWSVFIGQLLRILALTEGINVEEVFIKLFNLMKYVILHDLGKIEKSGSLHWFLSTVFTAVHESTAINKDSEHVECANDLVLACEEVLKDLGSAFQQKWAHSMHYTLSTKYGFSGLVFDLNMFDWPQQVMGLRTPLDNSETEIKQQNYKTAWGYSPHYTHHPTYASVAALPPMPVKPSAKPEVQVVDSDQQLTSGKLFSYPEHECMSFLEMLNLNIGDGNSSMSRFPWAQTVRTEGEWFDLEDKPDKRMSTDEFEKYSFLRFPIGSELMPGLLESEPLTFTCSGPSDYISVFNTEDGSSQKLMPQDQCNQVPPVKAPEVVQLLAAVGSTPSIDRPANYQLSNEIYTLFKQPPDLVLCAERCIAQSKKQVILDFGGPTLLTDFIIPSCEYLHAVYVDCWWYSDVSDETRIAQSTNIGSKALIVSNLYPGILVQKVKLTFVLRGPKQNSQKVRIPIGRFFGQKWLTNADHSLATLPVIAATGEPAIPIGVDVDEESTNRIISMLKYFCEEIRCRYNIASAELQKLVEEGYSPTKVKESYCDCFNLRLQWNVAYGVMDRFRRSTPESMISLLKKYDDLEMREWDEFDVEHLKSLCSVLLNFSNQLMTLLDLRDSARDITNQTIAYLQNVPKEEMATISRVLPTTVLNLETALDFFDFFCSRNIPMLQAQASAHIFKAGCFTSWWGDFFPAVLRRHFSVIDNSAPGSDIFLLLSMLCAQSVKHSYLQQVVMEKLFVFVIQVTEELMIQDEKENTNSKSPLLSWTLQLLSTAFDVVASNKRKTDRWSFLAGLFGQANSNVFASSSNHANCSTMTVCSGAMPKFMQGDQIGDKLYQRWKELFNNEEFSSELEKPQFIVGRLEILGDRLQYLFSLIKEHIHGIPAVMPQKSETFSPVHSSTAGPSEQPSSLIKSSSSANATIPDPTTGRLLIVPLHNNQSKIRVRQYSARLKISESLCLSVVHTLLKLLLSERSKQLIPYSSQLLAIKVISKICIHGSTAAISLSCALGDKLYGLIFKLLGESSECDWMRHALLMLLTDLTDAEMRTLGRNLNQKDKDSLSKYYEAYKSFPEEEEMEVEPKRHKLDVEIEMSEDNSILTVDQDQDMDEVTTPESVPVPEIYGPEGCKTAMASGIMDPVWAFVPPSSEIVTFSSFDKSGDDMDELIIKAAMGTIVGAKEENEAFLEPENESGITFEMRFGVLMNWMYRLTRYYCDRGEPLSYIFHYFDEAVRAEDDYYKKAEDSSHYFNFAQAVVATNGLRIVQTITTYKLQISTCALYFLKFLNTYCTEEKRIASRKLQIQEKQNNYPKDALNFRFFQAVLESKYSLRTYGIREMCHVMHLPEGEIQKFIQGHLIRFKHKIPELTSISVDCSGERMISADPLQLKTIDEKIKSFATSFKSSLLKELQEGQCSLDKFLGTYAKWIFINSNWPGMEQFLKQGKNHVLPELSLIEFNSATETPPENTLQNQGSIESVQPLDTDELKSALENLSTEDQIMSKVRTYTYAVRLQFEADLGIAGESSFVMPYDFVMDVLSATQFCYQTYFESRFKENLSAKIGRNCVYNFVPHCTTPKKGSSDDSKEDFSTGMGASVRSVVKVIDMYFSSLKPSEDPKKVADVLLLYLEYVGSISSNIGAYNTNKAFSIDKKVFSPPPLTGEVILQLMNYIINIPNCSEQLWQCVLAALSVNMKKETSILNTIAPQMPFKSFLQRFLSDSLHPYGVDTSFGQTTMEHFGSFIKGVIESENRNTHFLENFIDTVNELFEKPEPTILGTISVEPLLTAIEVIGLSVHRIGGLTTCDASKLSLLVHRVIEVIRIYFPRFESPLKSSSLKSSISQLCHTNICFTNLANDDSISTEINREENILPSLAFCPKNSIESLTTRKAKFYKPQVNTLPPSLDAFEYDTFEPPPPGGFEQYRSFGYQEQIQEKSVKDRTEVLFIYIIKLVDNLSFLGPIGTVIVQNYSKTINSLIELLNMCESAIENITEVNLEHWVPQTLADHILFELLSISNGIGETREMASRFMQIILQSIFQKFVSNTELAQLSSPVIFSLLRLNHQLKRKDLFVELGGHVHVAEQLKRALLLLTDRWPPTSNLFALGTQLTNLANEVNGIVPQAFDCRPLPSKVVNGVKLYNFAPYAKISAQFTATNLQTVLNDPVPNRRSRSSVCNYTFPANEIWLPLTITLPCQIMCHEITVRCHQYSALNSPSAIQVEVSEGAATRQWTLCGGQVNSAGLLTTSIDMSKYRSPVGAIKLYLKKPVGHSSTINLSQIMIYGVITSPQMLAEIAHEKGLVHWLTVYDQFQSVQPSLWHYAPKLPQALMQLFIRMPMDHKVYSLLRRVICNIDHRSNPSDSTVIELIMNYVISGGRLSEGVPPVVSAELLYSFCTESSDISTTRATARQSQLLHGIEKILDLIENKLVFHESTISVVLWSAACAIWNNVATESLRYQTVADCINTGTKITIPLWKWVTTASDKFHILTTSAAWLLCSLCRVCDEVRDIIIRELLEMEKNKPRLISSIWPNIGRIFQSSSASTMLINSGFLSRAITAATEIARNCLNDVSVKESDLQYLTTVVEFIADLSVIDVICGFLESSTGQELFKQLLSALVFSMEMKTDKRTSNYFAKLDQATIKICQRCISFSNYHREAIASELNRLLDNDNSKFSGRVDGTLLQLILRLVLEDEVITVCLNGVKGPSFGVESFKDQLIHPVFGCSSTGRVLDLSLFTTVRDLIPLKTDYGLQKIKAQNVANSAYDEFIGLDALMTIRRKIEPEQPESTELADGVVCDELGQRNLVARLFCPQISHTSSLGTKLNLRQLMWVAGKRQDLKFTTNSDSGIVREGNQVEEHTFGYNALILNVRITSKEDGKYDPDFNPQMPKGIEDLTMLQHFAMVGGFGSLSKHFPMADHYSAVLETFESLSKKQRDQVAKTTSKMGPEIVPGLGSNKTIAKFTKAFPPLPKFSIQPSVVQLHADINNVALATQALQQQVQSVLTHVSSSSSLQAMIAGTPVSLSVLEPSAIVTYPNGDPQSLVPKPLGSSALSSSSNLSYPDQMSQAIYSMIGNGQLVFAPLPIVGPGAKLINQPTSLNQLTDKDVPAYTIFALSMFLKLDYYAIALVSCDRFQAKRVLRAAMGLTNTERDVSEIMSNFKPIMPKNIPLYSSSPISCGCPERKHGIVAAFAPSEKTSEEKTKKDNDSLTIYPFFVLEKIWTLSGPNQCGSILSEKIRNNPETLSVLDVILLCASRFSNTPPKAQTSFSPSSDAQAIDQIFQLSDQIESLRDSMSNSNNQKPVSNIGTYTPMLQQMTMILDGPGTSTSGGGGAQDYWAKGTGFGSGTTQVQWNVNEHVRKRKLNEEAVTCMINTISGYLMPIRENISTVEINCSNIGLILAQIPYEKAGHFHKEPLNYQEQVKFDFEVASRIYNSCLMPIVHSYLTNDSVFDISKHLGVYEACIWFVIAIASLKPVILDENERKLVTGNASGVSDIFESLLMESCAGETIYSHIKKMHQMIKAYLTTIEKERNCKNKEKDDGNVEKQGQTADEVLEEEHLEALEVLLLTATDILSKRLGLNKTPSIEEMEVDKDSKNKEVLGFEELYLTEMKSLQYESIQFMKDDNKTVLIPHHFSSQYINNKQVGNPKRMRRLAQEAITLSSSLPLSSSSSVFLRASDERLDVFKVLITGPADTPYANGCFEFDAYFPPDYPNVPVQISLQTTGNNTVRFNPNLYNDGKVCLSVLNTWHGRPEERWNAETSSFLQVIVSIQSLILVSDPYFNEPGYERSRNTPAGQQASRDYDANIRAMTVRWAILEQIRNPPKAFEEVIKCHFYLKKDEITTQIKNWIEEMQKYADENSEQPDRTMKNSLVALKRNFELLKEEFNKMTPPKGLEDVNIPVFGNPSTTEVMEVEPTPGPSGVNRPVSR
ncbi:hypothetical protein FO519_004881 [Halicephalobus sp. NKZ332]|nr:hypothetical protein FO519_004881 [Halicephalobus sp. NKZ332]